MKERKFTKSIGLTLEQFNKIEEIAKENKKTKTQIINEMIIKYKGGN